MTFFVFSNDLFLHRQSTSKVNISISSVQKSLRLLIVGCSIPSFSSAKLSIVLPGTLRASSIRRDNTDFCCNKTSSCSHKVLINNTMHTPVPYPFAHCIAGLKCLIRVFTVRNEVAKVIFLQASVCPQGGWGCLPQCMLGYHPLGSRQPPRADIPTGAATAKQTPTLGADIPPASRCPPEQTSPLLGADTHPPE